MDLNSTRPQLYTYRSPTDFIEDHFKSMKMVRPELSLRKWATEMGFESPDYLVDVLKGKKSLKLSHVDLLIKALRLDATEENFFKALIIRSRLQSDEEKEIMETLLRSYLPTAPAPVHRISDSEVFSSAADSIVLELIKIQGRKWTEEKIRESLGNKVSSEVLKERLQVLSNAGLLQTENDGSMKSVFRSVSTVTDSPNPNFKRYYAEVSELASNAARLPVSEREFQCFSMAINPDRLKEMKDMIRNFRTRLESYASVSETSGVYQINLQCFPVVDSAG